MQDQQNSLLAGRHFSKRGAEDRAGVEAKARLKLRTRRFEIRSLHSGKEAIVFTLGGPLPPSPLSPLEPQPERVMVCRQRGYSSFEKRGVDMPRRLQRNRLVVVVRVFQVPLEEPALDRRKLNVTNYRPLLGHYAQ